jgi:hypothetical protein
MQPIRAFGNAPPAEVDTKEGKSGERCRSAGLLGGGRKAAVAFGGRRLVLLRPTQLWCQYASVWTGPPIRANYG